MSTLLKVCCIADVAEAHLAHAHGADMIGLVGPMPSGAGIIGLAKAAEIAAAAPAGLTSVLLTSSETAEGIADDVRAVRPKAVQIVRHVDPGIHAQLRAAHPGLTLIQVVHVEDETSLALAARYAASADMLLLDSGRPTKAELGGTGRTHDWTLSRRIVSAVPVPVLLAGGLQPNNARAALVAVGPAGLDICSGLRPSGGRLDAGLLADFARAIRPEASERRDP